MKNAQKWLWGAVAVLVTVLCAAGLLQNPGRKAQRVQMTTVAMGSVVTQTLYGSNETADRETASKASAAISALEKKISWRIDGSEIARLNAGEEQKISEETAALLRQCLQVTEKSGGAFQCVILPVSRLWDFESEPFLPPAADTVEAALQHCGSAQLQWPDASVKLADGAGIDLGAVGKGAGCDAAVAVYQNSGISAGIVSVGGSIGIFGEKPDRSAWTIGIRDPNGDASATLGTVNLQEGFISTSGTYEKQRESGGKQYHHLLDPKTGFPAKTDLVSATVHCSSGALSDALATAAVVLGSEEAPAFLESCGVEYLLVRADGTLLASERMRENLTLTSSTYSFGETQP